MGAILLIYGPHMTRVTFTGNLARHVPCEPCEAQGGTVREALDAAFRLRPGLREFVLDEQGELRRHMNVFVDGEMIKDRRGLSDPPGREIFVMQALSGG